MFKVSFIAFLGFLTLLQMLLQSVSFAGETGSGAPSTDRENSKLTSLHSRRLRFEPRVRHQQPEVSLGVEQDHPRSNSDEMNLEKSDTQKKRKLRASEESILTDLASTDSNEKKRAKKDLTLGKDPTTESSAETCPSSDDEETDACEVKVKSLDEFKSFLDLRQGNSPMGQKISLLKEFSTFVSSKEDSKLNRWELWISVTLDDGEEKWLNFRLSEAPFDSQVAPENDLLRVFQVETRQSYYKIEVSEFQGDDVEPLVLLNLMAEKTGRFGELFYIRKGSFLSGTQVYDLYQKLQKYLGVQKWILLDQAEITIAAGRGRGRVQEDLLLRQYLPIASNQSKTWYESIGGFKPFSISRLPGMNGHPDSKQSEVIYRSAVEKLRTITIAELLDKVFDGKLNEDRHALLQNLSEAYLKGAVCGADPAPCTLHDLVQVMLSQFRDASLPKRIQTQVQQDFVKLYQQILSPQEAGEIPGPPEFRAYNLALDILKNHRVWILEMDHTSGVAQNPLDANRVSFDSLIRSLPYWMQTWEQAAPSLLGSSSSLIQVAE